MSNFSSGDYTLGVECRNDAAPDVAETSYKDTKCECTGLLNSSYSEI